MATGVVDAKLYGENDLDELNSAARDLAKRTPWVYAHGKLEDDMGTDIVYLDEGIGNGEFRDKFVAYYKKTACVFHVYRNMRTWELQGVVTYVDDHKAYEYGRKLVTEKPDRF